MNLDLIDAKILEQLQANARISLSELSKNVNLSLSAVSERLKKLDASGIVKQYTALLDQKAMGKEISAIMLISLADQSRTEELIAFVNGNSEILEFLHITGEYDYYLKIVTGKLSELETIISDIKKVSTVRKTETIVILSTIKQNYSVSPVITKE